MILQTIIQEEIDSSQELANYEEARTIEPYEKIILKIIL